eukprot:1013110-Prorocentrum_minimum.AAC.2
MDVYGTLRNVIGTRAGKKRRGEKRDRREKSVAEVTKEACSEPSAAPPRGAHAPGRDASVTHRCRSRSRPP